MKIDASAIHLSAQRSYTEESKKSESLRIMTNGRETELRSEDGRGASGLAELAATLEDMVEGLQLPPARGLNRGPQAKVGKETDLVKEAEDAAEKLTDKGQLLKLLLEKIFGEKAKHMKFEEFDPGDEKLAQNAADFAPGNGAQNAPAGAPGQTARVGVSMAYDYHESYYEAEHTAFSASGIVKTADGREIAFQMGLEMSREYYTETNFSLRAGQAIDPLVLNFNGSAAELSDSRFEFDLDADGQTEMIPFLKAGSGFLAFDRNGDGTINDGSELFGPQSGQGFQELAALDEDGNGFIDEGDSAYSNLVVYNKDANGEDVVKSLKEADVGAVYLGSAETQFRMTDQENQTQANVQRSGVFLKESGGVGSVQQLDFSA